MRNSWFLKAMKKYADFSGRACRKEFWMFVLWSWIIIFAISFFMGFFLIMINPSGEPYNESLIVIIDRISKLLFLLPFLSVSCRRLHDVGKTGWFLLLALIPIIGDWIVIITWASKGGVGANKYGPDPTRKSREDEHEAIVADESITAEATNVADFAKHDLTYTAKDALGRAIADSRAIDLDPEQASTFFFCALAYAAEGDVDRAIADFDEVIRLEPMNTTALTMRGHAYAVRADIVSFKFYCYIYDKTKPYRGFSRSMKTFNRAIADAHHDLGLDPQNTSALKFQTRVHIAKGSLDWHISELDWIIDRQNRTLSLDPTDASAYRQRGLAKMAKGDLDGAIADFSQTIEFLPTDAVCFRDRGLAYLAKADFGRTIADLSQAIALDNTDTACFVNRSLAYGVMADFGLAIADLDQAIAIGVKDAITYEYRALARSGQSYAEQYLADHDHAKAPKIYDGSARIRALAGNACLAPDWLLRALAYAPETASWCERMLYYPEYDSVRETPAFINLLAKYR